MYYEIFERAQRGAGELTEWLAWFADNFNAHLARPNGRAYNLSTQSPPQFTGDLKCCVVERCRILQEAHVAPTLWHPKQ